jgi:hypothetical protein
MLLLSAAVEQLLKQSSNDPKLAGSNPAAADTRTQCYSTFSIRNLRTFVIR